MNSQRFWLWDWLDAQNVRSTKDAERGLGTRTGLNELRDAASRWEPVADDTVGGTPILAGAGLDISGTLDCPNPECQKLEIDKLFRHVWHYFDTIVLSDDLTHDVAHHWDDNAELRERLLGRIEVLLYARSIGAEQLLAFRPKGLDADWRQSLSGDEGARLDLAHDEVTDWLLREARVNILTGPKGDIIIETHIPEVNLVHNLPVSHVDAKMMSADALRALGVRDVATSFSESLASDIMTARRLRVPLGSSLLPHRRALRRSEELATQTAAFHLNLPVLQGVAVADLLRLRQDEHESFARFQNRLRLAMAERQGADGSASAEQVAREIERDIIQPELDNIRGRLAASERVLVKKSGVGLFLGALLTTCGLMAGATPAGAVGVCAATVASAVYAAASKHIEERRDISLEGMYFLWNAIGHAPR